VADAGTSGRSNQKRRTRKALLDAASRLMRQGLAPTLEDIAQEALVSRATAYRYFPSAEAVFVEAALDVAMPDAEILFADAPDDPVGRLERLDAAVDDMIAMHEPALRVMLINALQRSLGDDGTPARQNRRTPLIEAALAPTRDGFDRASLKRLSEALALVIGTESMIVFKDVLQLSDVETRNLKRWIIRALVDAARGRNNG